MSQSLKTIQTILKVLHILAMIARVFAWIGFVGCVLGGSILLLIPSLWHSMISSSSLDGELLSLLSFANLFASAISLLASCLLAEFTCRYLKHARMDGSPFTFRGAKELCHLGIFYLVLPLAADLIASIVLAIAHSGLSISASTDITVGIVLILLSYVVRYGAELQDALYRMLAPQQTPPQE